VGKVKFEEYVLWLGPIIPILTNTVEIAIIKNALFFPLMIIHFL